jgi:GntR family transcriptional regulator, transcriptional repressor for pyruvate dehydrogenase complex
VTPRRWQPTRRSVRGNAAEHIHGDLRDAILGGQFAKGSRLPTERQLAEGYGVSGPTVREAIRALTTARLIEVRHGSGAYVTAESDQLLAVSLNSMIRVDRIGVAEILGVLGALHAYAAERAAVAASDEEIARMQAAVHAIAAAATVDAIPNALIAFLGTLANAAGNPLLAVLCRFLTRVQVDLTGELSGGTLAGWRKTAVPLNRKRQRLVDAIRARDPSAAHLAARAYHAQSIKVIGALPHAASARLTDAGLADLLGSLLRRSGL